jgi:hypothetical protein
MPWTVLNIHPHKAQKTASLREKGGFFVVIKNTIA